MFGSELSSEVVMLDPGIPTEAFAVSVAPDGVTIEAIAEGGQRGERGGTVTRILAGQRFVWALGDTFTHGPVTLHLCGELLTGALDVAAVTESEFRRREMIAKKVRASVAILAATSSLVAVAYWFPAAASAISPGSSGSTAIVMSQMSIASASGAQVAAVRPVSATALTAMFVVENLDVVDVVQSDGRWLATVHIGNAGAQARLDTLAAKLPPNVDIKIFADAQLLQAARMVLDNLGQSTAGVAIDAGQITLSGVADDAELRQQLEHSLRLDVPGLRSVEFATDIRPAGQDIMPDIAGVWAGPRPYVLLRDGRMVRRGENLTDRLELVAIHKSEIVLREPARPAAGETIVRMGN